MKLEVEYINITGVQFGAKTEIKKWTSHRRAQRVLPFDVMRDLEKEVVIG